MPRDLTTEPDDRALLASAHADGTMSAEQRRRFDSDPALRAHAEQVAAVRARLGEPLAAPADDCDTAIAAALAAAADRGGTVVPIDRQRRWTTPVLAVAAAALLLGVVGVTVIGSGDGADEASSARTGDDVAVVAAESGAAESTTEAVADAGDGAAATSGTAPVTIASIDAPATAALLVEDEAALASLPDLAGSSGKLAAVSYSPAAGCLTDDHTFLADIVYQGVPAIAVRTADGTTLAIDASCTVVAEVAP